MNKILLGCVADDFTGACIETRYRGRSYCWITVVWLREAAYGLSFPIMPAWASRMAKSTATIKNMTIKIRSVVPDMAISLVVCA